MARSGLPDARSSEISCSARAIRGRLAWAQSSIISGDPPFSVVCSTLEVSSPGLDREFYRESDYERFAGERVKVTWRDPETGSKRTDVGTLARPEGEEKHFALTTDTDTLTIRLGDVITTRLEPVF